ncbi:hypothetical protein CTI12_AA590290 [Artemisia annua]|uniref:COI1 F-box domain-containing protein n=1 Tax=Artemisia annua TaxID=35608 RepID=A0A2U1KLB3_ARTAN|nr:hypothetical protein CTI12_AA590290 [Artemisia annua]
MAPTKRKTKHKPEETKVGEEVLDLVIPYIHNVEDRNSLSLVSRKCYVTDGITRKRVTVHTLYYPNPAYLSKRFPFIKALTLKGPPSVFTLRYHNANNRISPWIEQLALEFRCLNELHIHRLVVADKDLETLARTRGKDLRSLKISKCIGFSTDGLMHVSNYCNQLRTLCLKDSDYFNVKVGFWLHQLALNSTVLERIHVTDTDISYAEDLTLLAKNCYNSLISLKIGACYLSKLGDAFRYAVRLEHFGGDICDEESDLLNFRLPPNMRSLSIKDFPAFRYSVVFPFLHNIRKLNLASTHMDSMCERLLINRCPNLEVLYTEDAYGDPGLQIISNLKNLRKLTHNGRVTHLGLMALAKGCTKLECLKDKKDGTTHRPLDKGIRRYAKGCKKLERLEITLWHGGLTDVGLKYIGKGCPKLRRLELRGCPFSKQVVTRYAFDIPFSKIGACYLSKLGDAFRYAVRLEHFGGDICDEESDLLNFRLPPNMRSLSIKDFPAFRYSVVFPFLHNIRKLNLASTHMDSMCERLLINRCPNLEVLYTEDAYGDPGLQIISNLKNLRKLTHNGRVTHLGLMALAKGCTKLECLKVSLRDISNEAIKCVGTHLKNLRKFSMHHRCLRQDKKDGTTHRPLDKGIRAMLRGCKKLERLEITLWHGGLTDVGLKYIGKYGANLRSLSLTYIGTSNKGLVKLSEGCPKLRKLELRGCPFSKQVVTRYAFDIPSLRYVWFDSGEFTPLGLTRPEFRL